MGPLRIEPFQRVAPAPRPFRTWLLGGGKLLVTIGLAIEAAMAASAIFLEARYLEHIFLKVKNLLMALIASAVS
jgi:hypothetical protein